MPPGGTRCASSLGGARPPPAGAREAPRLRRPPRVRGGAVTRADDWVVQPERFVRYLREVHGLSAAETRLPPRGILVFGSQDLRMFARNLRARILRWNEWYARGSAGRTRIAVFRTTIGAPAAVVSFEEAVALGLRSVIAFGACGSLGNDLPIGSVVLPARAYSEEGTSRHYGGDRWSQPDPGLSRALRTARG